MLLFLFSLDEILTPLQNKIPFLNVIDAIRSDILSILYLIDIFVNLSKIKFISCVIQIPLLKAKLNIAECLQLNSSIIKATFLTNRL